MATILGYNIKHSTHCTFNFSNTQSLFEYDITLDSILSTLEISGFTITHLRRVYQKLDLLHNFKLKYHTTSNELIESILKDPESEVSQYVFKAIPRTSNFFVRNSLQNFPKTLVTERLKERIDYYKEQIVNLNSKNEYEKIVNEIYLEILHRPADKEGLLHYSSLLEKNKMTVDDVRKALLDSDEHKTLYRL